MLVISSTEFATHQDKYFNLAIDQDICIERGKNRFHLTCEPHAEERPILEPDEDLRNAITIDELRDSIHKHIHQLFAKK